MRALPAGDAILALPRQRLDSAAARLPPSLAANVDRRWLRLAELSRRLAAQSPQARIGRIAERLDGLDGRLRRARFDGEWPWTPDFRALVPRETTDCDGLDMGHGTSPAAPPAATAAAAGLLFTGYLRVPADGEYTFDLELEEGAAAHVWLHDAQLIAAEDLAHPQKPDLYGHCVLAPESVVLRSARGGVGSRHRAGCNGLTTRPG